jgi:hypothetical protein
VDQGTTQCTLGATHSAYYPHRASPYFLVYGSEVVLPTDVMWRSPTVDQYEECVAEETRQTDVNSLEEAHCNTLVQSARYLEKIRHYHDHNVKERSFNVCDLVLRRI